MESQFAQQLRVRLYVVLYYFYTLILFSLNNSCSFVWCSLVTSFYLDLCLCALSIGSFAIAFEFVVSKPFKKRWICFACRQIITNILLYLIQQGKHHGKHSTRAKILPVLFLILCAKLQKKYCNKDFSRYIYIYICFYPAALLCMLIVIFFSVHSSFYAHLLFDHCRFILELIKEKNFIKENKSTNMKIDWRIRNKTKIMTIIIAFFFLLYTLVQIRCVFIGEKTVLPKWFFCVESNHYKNVNHLNQKVNSMIKPNWKSLLCICF